MVYRGFEEITDPSARSLCLIPDWSVLAKDDKRLRRFLGTKSWLFNEETYLWDISHCFLDCYLLSLFTEWRGKTEFIFIRSFIGI